MGWRKASTGRRKEENRSPAIFGYIPIEKRVPLDSTIKETEGQWHIWLSSKGVFYEQRN